jgi:hypothetical protein
MAGTFDPPWSTLRQTWLLDSELNSGLITQCVARIHDRGTDQNGQRHDSKAYSLIELLVSGRPVLRYVEHHWRHVKYGFGRSFDAPLTLFVRSEYRTWTFPHLTLGEPGGSLTAAYSMERWMS